jgi:hypothetical protein
MEGRDGLRTRRAQDATDCLAARRARIPETHVGYTERAQFERGFEDAIAEKRRSKLGE